MTIAEQNQKLLELIGDRQMTVQELEAAGVCLIAELQNKPRWEDHPDAKCIAQNSTRCWVKNIITDCVVASHETGIWKNDPVADIPYDNSQSWRIICTGDIIGDWRDTLELRPADLSEPAVTERLTEATQTVLAAAPEKYRFDRNDWFERGELPPVGARCVALLGIAPKANCEVIAKTEQQMVVKWEENGMMDVIDLDVHVAFRPIRTERDELVNVFINHYGNPKGAEGYIGIADAILAAGYRKEPK